MPERLTEMESATLDVVVKLMREKAYPPSIREVAEEMGVTSTVIAQRFTTLAYKGYVEREFNEARAMRVLFTSDGAAYSY